MPYSIIINNADLNKCYKKILLIPIDSHNPATIKNLILMKITIKDKIVEPQRNFKHRNVFDSISQ